MILYTRALRTLFLDNYRPVGFHSNSKSITPDLVSHKLLEYLNCSNQEMAERFLHRIYYLIQRPLWTF